jgi:hypothetical protein
VSFYSRQSNKDPQGIYKFTFEGDDGRTVAIDIDLGKPDGPRIYLQRDGTLFLYNFNPEEEVRLFEYCDVPDPGTLQFEFSNWDSFKVDGAGQLTLKLTRYLNGVKISDNVTRAFEDKSRMRECYYIAVGEQSGEAHHDPSNMNEVISVQRVASVVAETGDEKLEILESPGGGKVISRVTSGTRLLVSELPEVLDILFFYDDLIWWHVKAPTGEEGWVMDKSVIRQVQ